MRVFSALGFLLIIPMVLSGQTYQGPASGSITGGVIVNTDDFSDSPIGPDPARVMPNKYPVPLLDPPASLPAPLGPESFNAFQYDPTEGSSAAPPPIELGSFEGIPETSSIPPDGHAAAGPNHIIATVNTSFRIFDKQGNVLKTITASSWYSSALSGAGPFDPQIMYDHFHDRWIMLWDHQDGGSATAYWLISVSDDDDPLGIWYNWALPAHLNGSSASGNWGDYPGIGFDQDALYIVSREFSFSGFYQYPKLRIVGTDQLYQNDAGPVTWTDLWDITDLSNFTHDGLRPTIVFTDPDEYFLISPTTFGGSNTYYVLYRLTDPLTAPVLTGVHVPVATWVGAPNASQLGGGMLIEAGGSRVRHAAVYRDSSLWMAHSVNNAGFSDIRYLRISTETNTAIEDARLGATGYWHYYPALMVDKDENVAITFSRSSAEEYIGAGMMWRHATDPVGLQPAVIFKEGEANYVKDFGSGRNRWGDYMGIALDPVEQNHFWMFTEYAESPANTWGTWWYHSRLTPYDNQTTYSDPASHDFGLLEVGTEPDTLEVSVYNVGTPDLTISGITVSNPAYTLIDLPSLPLSLTTFEATTFSVVFDPLVHGDAVDSILVASDDPGNPLAPIYLDGRGIVIGSAAAGVMYAASGPTDGSMYSVNTSTGEATLIGALGINEIHGLAINPTDNEIWGITLGTTESSLYRISAEGGDALSAVTVPIANMRALTFSSSGTMYGGTTGGNLYEVDPGTGNATLIGPAPGVSYSGLTYQESSGLLWASVRGVIGRDRIYTVDTATGDTTFIGRTGDFADTPYLAFGPTGTLYGLKGVSPQENSLITIDTLTAAGTVVGLSGVSGLTSIVIRTDSIVTSVHQTPDAGIPSSFELAQNYPNPFNPSTEIVFGLPSQSDVRLTVFNVLGQEVRVLVNGELPAGSHTATWDGRNNAGVSQASGLYFYKMEAVGGTAGRFSEIRKMLLVR
ncbi:MAG: T9SS type A sorting domain-containing protein [Ignavibacteria bacterium]|nr:T9SS type A sorting domain-containing protein [Ignavibacteria bacterium]